ncbi:coiled-coil domain-containing protein 186-like isoform X2 [Pecten maximus]|uniref:coiled-coil domain-containing protein 186-like isoform X2 n=1 Tax=Pecten maximus TaxID=6579 RepID=UPI0014584D74|nr:coiled-coil domain-containing protein 186-like isoform X2 [Pecten maximus]
MSSSSLNAGEKEKDKPLSRSFHQVTQTLQAKQKWLNVFSKEREKNELKSRIDELESYKSKYEQLLEDNQALKRKVDHMYLGQSDASQKLLKTTEQNDKLRLESKKKTEQIEKFQRDTRFMEDRVRNLEIRASEVDKAELILESTKQVLESTLSQLRGREHEIRTLTLEQDETEKKLQQTNKEVRDLENKMQDLKYQVRQELMKNENIEKNLETIPKLKEEIKEREEKLQSLQKDVDEKTILLATSRKAVREYREQLRESERSASRSENLKEEMDIAQYEVSTLKKLLQGKDFLIIQKSKALDLAKDVITSMKQSTEKEQIDKIVRRLEKIGNQQSHCTSNGNLSSSDHTFNEYDTFGSMERPQPGRNKGKHNNGPGIDVNRHPYSTDMEKEPYYRKRPVSASIFQELLSDGNEDMRTKTAIVRPTVKRTSSFKEAGNTRTHSSLSKRSQQPSEHSSGRLSSMDRKHLSNSFDTTDGVVHSRNCMNYDCVSQRTQSPRGTSPWIRRSRSELSMSSDLSSMSSDNADDAMSTNLMSKLAKLSSREKEDILCTFVSPGDRILFSIPQKPPRYGKKIVPKPKIYTGIVKYRGTLDKPGFDPRMFVGVRLDDPVGETDGMYKGKRYMYTPFDQGKFFKLLDATSVLDVEDGKYKLLSSLLCKHLTQDQERST